MNKKIVKLNLITCPDNLKREGYALFACIDERGLLAIGSKTRWYPKGIFRLAGGGIQKGEDPQTAALREFEEEFSLKLTKNELLPLVEIVIKAETHEGRFVESFYIFTGRIESSKVIANDDLDAIEYVEKNEFDAINNRLKDIDDIPDKDPRLSPQEWRDYGTLFSTIQKIVGAELKINNLW